jgi:hypothetical protein
VKKNLIHILGKEKYWRKYNFVVVQMDEFDNYDYEEDTKLRKEINNIIQKKDIQDKLKRTKITRTWCGCIIK